LAAKLDLYRKEVDKMKKVTLFIPALTLVLVGALLFADNMVSAQSDVSFQSSLVQKIADRFGLSESEVQAVFDEDREDMRARMEIAYEDRLGGAVASGDITEEQKELILDKRAELEALRDGHHSDMTDGDLTEEERDTHMAEMQAMHDELSLWAEEKGIDLKYLMGFGMKGPGEGFGSHHMRFMSR